jgi:hypothetical protein
LSKDLTKKIQDTSKKLSYFEKEGEVIDRLIDEGEQMETEDEIITMQ